MSEKDIKDAIEDIQKRKGVWKDAASESKAKDGQRVELDFQGYMGKVEAGNEAPNTKSVNHPLILGSKTFIPGFEEEIIGMRVGEEKEFTVTFPKNYHVKDFEGKKIIFKAKLNRLEEQELPEVNDAFVKELTQGKKNTVKEFEAYIKEILQEKMDSAAKEETEKDLIELLLKEVEVEVAPVLLEQEAESLMKDFKHQLETRGQTIEQHMEKTGQKEEALKKGMEEEAERRIKMRFALDYIIAEEKFEVTEAELNAEIEKILKRYPENEQAKIKEYYGVGKEASGNGKGSTPEGRVRLKNTLLVGKVFDMYLKKE